MTSRRQRHLDELRGLCGSGAVARAVDLAFAHLADFGPDEEVLELLAEAVAATAPDDVARARFADLTAAR